MQGSSTIGSMPLSFEERLRRYAQVVVRGGLNIQPGQELILSADISEAALARLATEEAYTAGAKNVLLSFSDEPSTLIRYAHGSDAAMAYSPQWLSDAMADQLKGGAAFLRIYGSNPSLLKGVDPAKIATASKAQAVAGKAFSEAVGEMASNWCIVGHASPAWAKEVFPGETEEVAVNKLWEAIFLCTCVDEADPVKAWNDHCAGIENRRDTLNTMKLTALHFKSPGTDLTVGLADGHKFAGGRVQMGRGMKCSPNVPTEEVFTMPHRDRVDGVVRSTKTLSLRGQLIEGIEMHFEAGKVVDMKAEKGEDVLQGLLDTDEGAKHLGEVALVPNSSRVSRANLLFLNTLYDENAACHIALGRAIAENMEGVKNMTSEQQKANGMNDSMVHVDWMIGSGETDIDGIRADGSRVPIMRAGEWA
jgi:aminopeptidase